MTFVYDECVHCGICLTMIAKNSLGKRGGQMVEAVCFCNVVFLLFFLPINEFSSFMHVSIVTGP